MISDHFLLDLLGALLVVGLGGGGWYVRHLHRAAARGRSRLVNALESLSLGFALYDGRDRLILHNRKLLEFFPSLKVAMPGAMTFEEQLRAVVAGGDLLVPNGDPEKWIRSRLLRHRHPGEVVEFRLPDGRMIEVREHATSEGGVATLYADVTERVATAEELRRHEAELEKSQELARLGSWVHDLRGGKLAWSRQLYRIFGHDPADFVPSIPAILEAVHPADRERYRAETEHQLANPDARSIEFRILRPDGTVCHIRSVRDVVRDGNGTPIQVTGIAQDITERRRTEESLDRLFLAIEQSPVSVVITDAAGHIEYINPAFVRVTGYTPLDVIGRNPRVLKSGFNPESVYRDLWSTIASGREWRGELHNRRKSGETFWEFASISPIKDSEGQITHFLAFKEDITQRKAIEEKLLRQANYDELTDLPNRVLAMDRLSQAVAHAAREHQVVAAMILNLDDLKKINDSLGHAAGDALLVEMARRMAACVRDGDTVARLEGDQFLVILPDLTLAVFAEVVAQKILAACAKPFAIAGAEVSVTSRIGLTVFPTDGADPYVLLRNAHAAVGRAKEMGGNTYRFFTPRMNEVAVRRLAEENLLRQALERGELYLVYQPLVDAATGETVGAEALLRWNNPQLGLVPPDQFIATAEKTGMIVPIGEWVLRQACAAARRWRDQMGRDIRIGVNVSFRQFKGGSLTDTVERILQETGLPADCLELEITERVLIDDAPDTAVILNSLHEMGVRLSMDDFGTGYSSLSYLKKFPFDIIKVDRSFVRDVTDDPEDAALATGIIALGRSLGLKIIAEGVETAEQLAFLRERDCHLIQGYFLSRPLSEPDFLEFLASRERSG